MQPPNLEQIDSLLRIVDREIWLITAAHNGQRSGLTATWVSQVSLDPERPVLLAGLSPRNYTTELVQQRGLFAAHLMTHEQLQLAYALAAHSGRQQDKLAGVQLSPHESGALILTECRAWFVGKVFRQQSTGDREFFWADVIAAGENAAGPALREQAFFQGLTATERIHLKELRASDALALRAAARLWRQQPTEL
ncbi:Flavin reductase like domain protein [Anatilimnocola aggregata]|uniref:Flavin reductase like domain protein n=1 Tax=Anatilimnocola aggregata TaxID=2528021 RepID=A0A517YL38_9BACT|nr:flavin reductase family protein [Anatilimnocola aggregata]QDU30941.1 Flavin reductase like domain protein [Anatilimnocola aggregata]